MKLPITTLGMFSIEDENNQMKSAWDGNILNKINEFINQNEKATIVFDADGTLWADDVSEAFLRWLIAGRKLLNVDYSQGLYQHYENLVLENAIKAYEWIVKIMANLREEDIKKWATDFFHDHFSSRIYASQKNLIADFKKRNYDIWVVSASHQWIVKAGAAFLGIDESHVLGVRLTVEDGLLTDKIDPPFPYHQGKVEAIKKFIPNQPAIVFGDSAADLPMLSLAKDLRIFITHDIKQEHFPVAEALQLGCLIQYFPLAPALTFDNVYPSRRP